MNRDDFDFVTREQFFPPVHVSSFTTGTQLYGYTCERRTFHVYVMGGHLHRFLYRQTGGTVTDTEYDCARSFPPDFLVPDKRVYPERTSLVMARLLRQSGIDVPYTTYDDNAYEVGKEQVFHGLTHEDLPGGAP